MLGQFPLTYILQKFHIGYVLSSTALLWGVTVSCSLSESYSSVLTEVKQIMTTPACHSFASAMLNRFFLGVLESATTPALNILMSHYWTIPEQPVRMLTWYSFQAWAGVVGSLLGYGVGHINGTSIPRWGWIFLICGAITILWSFVIFLVIPSSVVSIHGKNIMIDLSDGSL
jgi:MFS family permease